MIISSEIFYILGLFWRKCNLLGRLAYIWDLFIVIRVINHLYLMIGIVESALIRAVEKIMEHQLSGGHRLEPLFFLNIFGHHFAVKVF